VKVLECFTLVFEAAPDVLASYPDLASLLSELWDSADATGLGAGTTSIYKALLRTVFHTTIVRASVRDDVTDVLTAVCFYLSQSRSRAYEPRSEGI
jgi:hypothetical protein